MMGNEGYRMKGVLNKKISQLNLKCILPPSPREMGTYIPEEVENQTYELESLSIESNNSIPLAMAFELTDVQKLKEVFVTGFDGYWSDVTSNQLELAIENENIFSKLNEEGIKVISLTETKYENLIKQSIYSKISI
jgi:4-hydroxy 2-oxovalerate aldolase